MRFHHNDEANNFFGPTADRISWHKMIEAPDAIRQRVVFALTEWFVVSSATFNETCFASAAYWDMLAEHALGNFRDLLKAVTLSYCMGSYLNMVNNLKGDPATGREPDQNFAREVMQLFTIGLYKLHPNGTYKLDANGQPINTYDQNTIVNLAKVLTGWVADTRNEIPIKYPVSFRQPMIFKAERHDSSSASFLGTTIPAGTDGQKALDMVIDTLFNHPNVGPFFGRYLIQRLVTSNPPPGYVARVARAFNDNGQGVRGDMKAVVRAVLLDPIARRPGRRRNLTSGKLREPVVRMVQWARTFNAYSTAPGGEIKLDNTTSVTFGLAQSPLRSPSVFNFFRPGYVPPNTVMAKENMTAPEFQITDENTVAAYINVMEWAVGNMLQNLKSNYTAELRLVNDVPALVARLNLLLTAGRLTLESARLITKAAQSVPLDHPDGGPTWRIATAVLMVMVSPDYIVQK